MHKMISNIVFTKNRPLQLEAYLESLYRHMPRELIQSYVIYKVNQFGEQYSDLFEQFDNCIVINEENFHDDIIGLLEGIDTKYILFGTDDVVYFDSVDFAVIDEVFDRFTKNIFGFSLRLDPTSLQTESKQILQVEINGENIYAVNWKNAKNRNAKYPFELNSTIYRTSLVKRILTPVAKEHPTLRRIFRRKSLLVGLLKRVVHVKDFFASIDTFHNPNTLEGHSYRWCKTHKGKLPDYLYFQKVCASAVQINRVNTTTDNPIDGLSEHTVQALNEKYKQGCRLDIKAIEKNKPQATHVGREYFKLVKIS